MIEIRAARPADADAIAAVHVASWRVGYRHIFTDSVLYADDFESSRLTGWRQRLGDPIRGFDTLVAVVDESIVGFSNVGPERERDGGPTTRGEVWAFYLHPDAWGSGLATSLMEASIQALRDQDFSDATLWVLDDNPRARAFYEKAGWTPTGRATTFDRYCDEQVPEVEYARGL